jgi:hypothetical protein
MMAAVKVQGDLEKFLRKCFLETKIEMIDEL